MQFKILAVLRFQELYTASAGKGLAETIAVARRKEKAVGNFGIGFSSKLLDTFLDIFICYILVEKDDLVTRDPSGSNQKL